jgi:hypothetical protein
MKHKSEKKLLIFTLIRYGAKALSIITLGMMTLSIMTLSIIAHNTKNIKNTTFCLDDTYHDTAGHNALCHYARCHILIVMLSVNMLNVIMLCVVTIQISHSHVTIFQE